jgi:hypothetical protein
MFCKEHLTDPSIGLEMTPPGASSKLALLRRKISVTNGRQQYTFS